MERLEPFRRSPGRSALFLDFDGTLAPIVEHPDDARPLPGAVEALAPLASRFGVLAIVTGRPSAQVVPLLDGSGAEVFGLYGLEREPPRSDVVARVVPLAEAVAAGVPGAWVERKGLSLAVHYRNAPDPDAAAVALRGDLAALADGHGLELMEGKRVLELAAGRPSKGALVERVAREHRAEHVLYAGDDLADLDAFEALDRLAAGGVDTVRVAVRGAETPPALLEHADLVVDGPAGLIEALRSLAA